MWFIQESSHGDMLAEPQNIKVASGCGVRACVQVNIIRGYIIIIYCKFQLYIH